MNLLMDRVVEHMTEEMIDLVTDESAAGLLRSGKLQDNPTIKKINILIREGGDELPDVMSTPYAKGINSPTYELGGGQYFRRRFVAEYQLFFIGETNRSTARSTANVVFSRFQNKIRQVSLSGLTDSFGETAIAVQVLRLLRSEGGGPGAFIWRGTHEFEFLTYCE